MGYDFIPPGMKVVNGKLVGISENNASRDDLAKLLNEQRELAKFWQAEAARIQAQKESILDAGVPGYIRKDRKALEDQIEALKKENEALKLASVEVPAKKKV
jgi:hypothetical protein